MKSSFVLNLLKLNSLFHSQLRFYNFIFLFNSKVKVSVLNDTLIFRTPTFRIREDLNALLGEKEFIQEFLNRLNERDIVWDVGASYGLYTIFSAKRALKGKVYAFEPEKDTFKLLTSNISLNEIKNIIDENLSITEGLKSQADVIATISRKILAAFKRNRKIIIFGNGGSAVCASHWCNDLTNGTKVKGKKTIKAISLTDNTASITAIANDSGYENVFLLQLENLLTPGDIVIGISASGNSPNVVKAFEFANSVGATTVALIGFDGGIMKSISKVVLHIPTNKGEYGPVEDIQLVLDHLISSYIRFSIEKE